jgi:acylaminoacyl-peptidase
MMAQENFDYLDIFQLEWVSDPVISPDGTKILYVRNYNDITVDRNYSNIWIVNADGTDQRPVTTGNHNDFSPAWSADGKKILYKSNKDGSAQLYLRWLDGVAESKLTNLTKGFGSFVLSPDGKWVAFTMFVESKGSPLVTLPPAPNGAKWASPPKYIDEMTYRADGSGYLQEGNNQLFVLSIDGGTPTQITSNTYSVSGGINWSTDSKSILFSANNHDDREFDPNNSEVLEIVVATKSIKALTSRKGPDDSPVVSPDGKSVAYLGFDDTYQGYQVTNLYTMARDGSGSKLITGKLDRDVENIHWAADGKGLYFQFDDQGNTTIAFTDLSGNVTRLAQDVGGLSLGRPYSGGTFSVARNGRFAFTHSTPDHPADLATGMKGTPVTRITRLNDDVFGRKKLGKVEEIWYESSHDKRKIQGWICYPPDFDASRKYPLMLEIHGGPFTNYGDRFSVEIQLYASKGYVVLYTNPRGSTSYGGEFGNLIHHNYPGQDYDDLMSGVDAVISKGFVDTDNLFVTGGSGGGVLTAWIVGHTTRFRAAVVAKPVINWYSFVLYSDNPGFFYKYWFPGMPWDHVDHYMERSPISYAKNVKTPTMLLTGEQDYRTPMGETEQYYAALKLNKVETAMVRIQESGHGIANRPSNLMAKVAYIVGWFDRYRKK